MARKMVTVRAVKGRIARESARGRMIPDDAFVKIPETAYLRRLIDVHGDLEEKQAKPPATAKSTKGDTENGD